MRGYKLNIDFNMVQEFVKDVHIPPMYKVYQHFDTPRLNDPVLALENELEKKEEVLKLLNGKRICIACGSRGIRNIDLFVIKVVEAVKKYGGTPFIIPAMGSHGGATPDGQKKVLEDLGITEEKVGASIISNLDVESVGETPDGIPVYVSKDVLNSDGVILLNRVKPHTSFRGDIESGLLKMAVIGLGKQKGADLCHKMGFENFSERLKEMAKIVMSRVPIILGVALVENSYDETALVKVITANEIFSEEPKLLELAKQYMPKILLNDLDVLIVDEIGKDVSGDGMDPNVTGRFASDYVKGDLMVNRLVVLRLTEKTEGNANGIGTADIIPSTLLEQIDFTKGYINSITAAIPKTVKLPMVMPNDLSAIKCAIKTANNLDFSGEKSRIVRIKNTLSLDYIYVSESLMEEVKATPNLSITEGPFDFEFDEDGQLLTWW